MIRQIDGRSLDNPEINRLLKRPSHLDFPKEGKMVKDIVKGVKEQGEKALLDFIKRFDEAEFNSCQDLLVNEQEIKDAYHKVPETFIKIIERAKERIWNYHSKQKRKSWISFEEDSKAILGQKIEPMERVGIYVPGGRAAYPSSVLMNAIPAQIAGVGDIVMATPSGSDGIVNPYTLVAGDIAGIDRIYKMGGAHAVAAMAFGVGSIPKVDKITGPGNIYVTLAKKEVYGYVDIDMIAGPSEIVIVADNSANPAYVAADLLSQAEHDPLASSILITNDYELSKAVEAEIKKQTEALPKLDIIRSSLKDFGAIILVDNLEQGIDLANEIAPEHLELMIKNPFESLGRVKNAGSIFLGDYSPEPLGDYMAGPNHILPTSGSARFFSPLSVDDFIKKSSIISFTKAGLQDLYEDIAEFARAEGLEAHARSAEVRFNK